MKVMYEYVETYLCPNNCGGEEFDEYAFVPVCGKCRARLSESPRWICCPYCGTHIEWDDKPVIGAEAKE